MARKLHWSVDFFDTGWFMNNCLPLILLALFSLCSNLEAYAGVQLHNQSGKKVASSETVTTKATVKSFQTIGQKYKVPTTAGLKPLVPGTGTKIEKVGDDFEDKEWKCELNLPKSSHEMDNQRRFPGATTKNGRWFEGAKRGTPDIVKRVDTPESGLKGSTGSMYLRTLNTGIPGRHSRQNQQDDFVCNVQGRLGGAVRIDQSPSCVIRLFLPPFDTWERREGAHFGFRLALSTTVQEARSGGRFFRGGTVSKQQKYWPGIFVDLKPGNSKLNRKDEVRLRIRGNNRGLGIPSIPLTKAGWWTLGMSVSKDGAVHYFAKEGAGDLTAADHITSQFPYGFRGQHFHSFFLNVVNGDDGRHWSTPMIIDDAFMYFVPNK